MKVLIAPITSTALNVWHTFGKWNKKIVTGDTIKDQSQQRFFTIVTTMIALEIVVSWIVVALTYVAVGAAFVPLAGSTNTFYSNPKN